jgi:sensor histidine kinase YesM
LKSKINIILPIALALILPGLSYYSNAETVVPEGTGMAQSWLLTSLVLYLLWHILWITMKLNSRYRVLWIVLILTAYFGLSYFTLGLFDLTRYEYFRWFSLIRFALISAIFLLIQYALKAEQNIARLRLEKEQIQSENYRVQLKALRGQVDPHFLFNSLNTLRSMVRQQNANSEKFVMSLSDFYRQTLRHNENTTLPLSAELQMLESYLFVMKSRNEDAIFVHIEIDDALLGLHLPTLALQVVVENCFKHNSMTSTMPLHIDIENVDGDYISVTNNIQPKMGDTEPSEMGLDLLRKRYALMDVNQGVLIEHTPDRFSVQLKLI